MVRKPLFFGGGTEIVMLIPQDHTWVPLYDTTVIHAAEAVKLAMGPNQFFPVGIGSNVTNNFMGDAPV